MLEMHILKNVVFWTVASANCLLAGVGAYEMWRPIKDVWDGYRPNLPLPYFKVAFGSMVLLNAILLTAFVTAAVYLYKLRPRGSRLHYSATAALLVYILSIAFLWNSERLGASVAAASGIANPGVARFLLLFGIPGIYLIVSSALLLVVQRNRG
jgi:hypothetical protein